MLDLTPWLNPLEGPNPSGASLRDDPRFHEIERLIQPAVVEPRDDGGAGAPAVDWTAALAKAEALRAEGRDLRLLVIVARGHANERGLAGLADGLTLIARSVEAHWETMHPELRASPSAREAAMPRFNALMQLKNDRGLLGDLRRRVFFTARGLGPVTGRDLELGALDNHAVVSEAPGGPKEKAELAAKHEQTVARVRGAVAWQAEHAAGDLAGLTASARAALAALDDLEAAWSAKVGEKVTFEEAQAPSPRRFLTRMLATLERPAADAAKAGAGDGNEAAPPEEAPAADVAAPAAAIPGRLSTRAEVMACLDRIIEFYDRTEPASPVPYLARRMRRMVPMDFLQLMEDLAPSGLKEFRSLAGLEDKK